MTDFCPKHQKRIATGGRKGFAKVIPSVSIRFDDAMFDAICGLAKDTGNSFSAQARALLRERLQEIGKLA